MPKLVVAYPRHEGARFDTEYYESTHVPLVEKNWGPAGMRGAEILYPAGDDQPFACMILLDFPDDASIDAAMRSDGTPEVMGDVPKFTDIQPTVYRTR